MKDYYQILGVARTASDAEIKTAYRRLASQHHPDKGGDTKKFQEVEEAYRVLSNPNTRAEHDNPAAAAQARWQQAGGQPFNFSDIFDMFGTRFTNDPRQAPRPNTVKGQIWIDLQDVIQGGLRAISIATTNGNSSNVEIEIPKGISDGESVRYARLAPGGHDLVLQYRVRPNAQWQQQGLNLIGEITVMIWDLVTGTDRTMVTPEGKEIVITVPAQAQPGAVLRVRGHGIPARSSGARGDLLLKIQTRLPETISPELLRQIKQEIGQ